MQVEFRFLKSVDVEFTGTASMNGRELSQNVVRYLLAYGLKQSVDDAGAQKGKDGSLARIEALLKGNVPAGGGGAARLSHIERATRDVVERLLRKAGAKAVDAKKAATDPEAAIRKATAKAGNFDTVMAAVNATAQKLAEKYEAADAVEVELSLI